MKRLTVILSALLAVFACPMAAQTDNSGSAKSGAENVPETTYHLFFMVPTYRFVSTTGNGSRVGEYDTLQQSVGGDLAMTYVDFDHRMTIKSRAELFSRDDFDIASQLRWGKSFSLSYESRSFIRHQDDVQYRADLSADDIVRTEPDPGILFGIKRTKNDVNARFKVPNSPVTLFVKGGWQARRGTVTSQFYDMGNQNLQPGVNSCDGSCHSTASLRPANYTTRNIAGGVELKVSHATVTYEHEYRSFNNRLQPTYGYFGTSGPVVPGEEQLPLPTTPTTLEGFYLYGVLPRHETQLDTVRIHLAVSHGLTFNGAVNDGRTRNQFTGNPQNSFNADMTLNWNVKSRLRAIAEFHQQNLVNDFVPTEKFFPLDPSQLVFPAGVNGPVASLFGNPSLHRYWTGLRLEYSLSPMFDVESYYKRTNVTRSNANTTVPCASDPTLTCPTWPQQASPNNAALLTALNDVGIAGLEPWAAHLVPTTFSNTAGMALKFHRGEWMARAGYEWVGTHAPGYLTDPQTAHRAFGSAGFSPAKWLTFSNDFSVLLESSAPGIERTNHLWTNTAYLLVKPVPEYTLGVGYSYVQQNLRSDLVYRSDVAPFDPDPAAGCVGLGTTCLPVYSENLVPFKSISNTVTVTSSYLLKKSVAFNVDYAYANARSDFRPNTDPNAFPLIEPEAVAAVALGRDLSMVKVPQTLVSSGLDYRWKNGFSAGFRFQYGRYLDLVHPDQTGLLRGYTLFAGRAW
jgi:hypothetical protein